MIVKLMMAIVRIVQKKIWEERKKERKEKKLKIDRQFDCNCRERKLL